MSMRPRSFLFYLPERSPFLSLSAISKLSLVVAISVAAVSALEFYYNLSILVVSIAILIVARVPLRNLKLWFVGFVFMMVFISAMYTLLSKIPGETVYATLPWGTFVTENTPLIASAVAFRILSMVLTALVFLSTTTDADVLSALYTMRIPYTISFMISLALRSLTMFSEDWKTILDAYWSKGVDINKGNIIRRLRNYIRVTIPLMILTLNKVRDIDFAAESRGFRLGIRNRTVLDRTKLKAWDHLVIAASASAIALLAYRWLATAVM